MMFKAICMKLKYMKRSFSPLLGYSLQFTQEVSGVCFPSATSRTPPPLIRVAKDEFLGTILSSKWNQLFLHSGFPPVC